MKRLLNNIESAFVTGSTECHTGGSITENTRKGIVPLEG